ncbi:MAG TPA: ankyrin repeat domain-containing protein [Fimbriimonadaceae bacterium]|jgi:hypothetical protein
MVAAHDSNKQWPVRPAKLLQILIVALVACSYKNSGSSNYLEFGPETSISDIEDQIRSGADPNKLPPNGHPPLLLAVASKQLDLVGVLITAGAKVDVMDSYGRTPLMLAAFSGQPGIAEVLLANGAAVNATYGNFTALGYAISKSNSGLNTEDNYLKTEQILISRGAVFMAMKSKEGPARFWGFGSHFEQSFLRYAPSVLVAEAISQGASPVAEVSTAKHDPAGFPLYWASTFDRTQETRVLLAHGANPNQTSLGGKSALAAGAVNDSLGSAKLLLAAGAKVDLADSYGRTPLVWTAELETSIWSFSFWPMGRIQTRKTKWASAYCGKFCIRLTHMARKIGRKLYRY